MALSEYEALLQAKALLEDETVEVKSHFWPLPELKVGVDMITVEQQNGVIRAIGGTYDEVIADLEKRLNPEPEAVPA